jgi:hypothetical protein
MIDEIKLEQLAVEGDVRLLVVEGRHIWEASPSPAHQMIVDDIRATIQSAHTSGSGGDCGSYHLADTNLTLTPEKRKHSQVRPDIAIYGERPPRQQTALRLVPAAVIEIVSPRYEEKDLEALPPAYLHAGVLDVLVYEPQTQVITWWDQEGGEQEPRRLTAPQTITLRCGCQMTIG